VPFGNPILSGLQLIRQAIQSAGFVAGLTGWSINRDGTAEFNSTTIRGSLTVVFGDGSEMDVNGTDGIALFNASDVEVAQLTINSFDPNYSQFSVNRILINDLDLSNNAYVIVASDGTSVFRETLVDNGGGAFDVRWGFDTDARLILESNAAAADVDIINNGSRVAQADLVQSNTVRATAPLVLTTVFADLTGVTWTFTTLHANAVCQATGWIDNTVAVAIGGGGVTIGELVVDGVNQTGEILGDAASVNRSTVGQSWTVTLAAAGAHTIKLQGRKSINAGTVTANSAHTSVTATVYDFYS
jgi:hypothetical protein